LWCFDVEERGLNAKGGLNLMTDRQQIDLGLAKKMAKKMATKEEPEISQ
jgi:hypothetical protein